MKPEPKASLAASAFLAVHPAVERAVRMAASLLCFGCDEVRRAAPRKLAQSAAVVVCSMMLPPAALRFS